MAKFEDYLPGGEADPNPQTKELEEEVKTADAKQEERKTSTPETDWENKYKELEKFTSQQGNVVGDYKRIIDDYILKSDSTSTSEPAQEESTPITYDDLYENPDDAIAKAVANHPDVLAAKQLSSQYEADTRERALADFRDRHPDYEDIAADDSFRGWVRENNTRMALAQAADNFDMNSADALFSLYKAEKGLTAAQAEQQEAEAIQAATLEDSTAVMVDDSPKYSRSEFINKRMRAEQGDLEAQDWVNRNVAKYREALGNGNVRD